MVDIVNKFIASNDNAERAELMKQYQKLSPRMSIRSA